VASRSLSGSHALVFNIFDVAVQQSHLVFKFLMFGIRRLLFFRSMKIAGSLHIFMDTHSIFTNGDIGGMRIDPRPQLK